MLRFFRRGAGRLGARPPEPNAPDRFPGFDVLDEVEHWDVVTAGVVLSRLATPPPVRFFTPAEEAIGRAVFDLLLDQREQGAEDRRIPVFEMVDGRLAEFETDGWHHADLPEDGDAFRQSFAALDGEARQAYGDGFAVLEWHDQGDLLELVRLGKVDWPSLDPGHIWDLWTRYSCTAFYGHPHAWNEVGFGGPAYPRGYKNPGLDAREPWEVADHEPVDPMQRGEEFEKANRRHAEVRTRQLRRHSPDGPSGVGDALREKSG